MKNILLLICIIIVTNNFAQTLKPITIVSQRSYYLNGGTRAEFAGGKSRETIKIDLPANTKSWYYSFSTSPGVDGTELLNLGVQLTAALYGGPTIAPLTSSLKVPKGSGSADVYVLTSTSRNDFLQKTDNWRFFKDISAENSLQAVQYVENKYGTSLYLGLKNPSSLSGIAINIEVVALVEQDDPNYDKGTLYGNLGWEAFKSNDYNKCLEMSNKALSYCPNLAYVKFNIALTYLVQGNPEYLEKYIDAIANVSTDKNPKQAIKGALEDIQNLKKLNWNLPNITSIENMLINASFKY